ncbi:MAG: haloacid dehalogenase type II [Myxococcales bacterium]|nr:haloacid dehalogenase type II [Myxococcales bacterium]
MIDPNRYRVLSFDCYGTLIDWESGILEALRPLLARKGVEPTDDELLELHGRFEPAEQQGPYRSYRRILEAVLERFAAHYGFVLDADERGVLADAVASWRPFPDTVAALQRLATRFRLVVISNIDNEMFSGSARQLEVAFDDVITAEELRGYKPRQSNFTQAIVRIGERASAILHVAQSLYHDIAPAKKLGLSTVWVNRRQDRAGSGATPPASATPDLTVPDLTTLATLLVP